MEEIKKQPWYIEDREWIMPDNIYPRDYKISEYVGPYTKISQCSDYKKLLNNNEFFKVDLKKPLSKKCKLCKKIYNIGIKNKTKARDFFYECNF